MAKMARIVVDVREVDKVKFQKKCYDNDVPMGHALRDLIKNYNKTNNGK